MRPPTDMPRRRTRRVSGRGRTILIVVAIGLFLLVTSLRGIAGFYTDFLWFDSLDLASVWRKVLGAKAALAVIFTGVFFVALWLNLFIADRIAPRFRPGGPEEEMIERYHDVVGDKTWLVRVAVSALFALIAGVGVSSEWESWILFTNRVDFGEADATFGTDIGFYVFTLPFLSFVANWAFVALIIIFAVTAGGHYLNGGIRFQTPMQRVTPQVKAHLSVLLALMALVRAGQYLLDRYELTLSDRGFVNGATYTDVNVQDTAILLLLAISLVAVGLFIINIWRRGWVLPTVAVVMWAFVAILAGGIVPALVQRFQVEPAESAREAPYIENNIEATRAAPNMDSVDVNTFDYEPDGLTAEELEQNDGTIRNVRLLDPNIVQDTYQQLQGVANFYRFLDLDVDRYEIDGRPTQVVVSARELNPGGVPQQSWEGQHLAFTHGYGPVLAPANAVTQSGRPDFAVRNIPVDVAPVAEETFDIDQPQLYFGEGLSSYAVTGTERAEVDYQVDGETEEFAYDGEGGVQLSGFVRQAAFALRFGEIEPLISNLITDDSKILYQRDIVERVETLAPFLHFDADPYPVVIGGRTIYVIDAYTTSNRYPNAQRVDTSGLASESGLNHEFNYVRNSVKAVVDTYDGDVTFYVVDDSDPLAEAYAKAFPDLFSPSDEVPDELRAHFRYPEDLFTAQTTMWGRYHLSEPDEFYEQTDGWSVAQDPGDDASAETTTTAPPLEQAPPSADSQAGEGRIPPQYLLMRLPEETDEEFVMLRSFVPVTTSADQERRTLTAFMVARSDPENYGELKVYEMEEDNVEGPGIIASNILSDQDIAEEIALLAQQGSEVRLGNLQLIPIEESLLYVRPHYTQARGENAIPQLRFVIAAYGENVEMQPTLQEALGALFDTEDVPETLEGQPDDPEDVAGEEPPPEAPLPSPDEEDEPDPAPDGPPRETGPAPELDDSDAAVLAEVEDLFTAADQALAEGDLSGYEENVDAARALLSDLMARLEPEVTPTGEPPPSTTSTTTLGA